MAQAADRLLLDLAHTLARQVELLADLLERHLRASDAEEVLDDVALTLGQSLQSPIDLRSERLVDQPAVGIGRIGIHQHVKQRVVLTVGKRGIHRNVTSGNPQRIGHLLLGQLQLRGELLGRRSALVFLLEAGESLVDLVERTHLVERQTHNARLLGQRLEDRLTDPPHRIGDELETAGFVELLGRLDQAEVAFVDQVGKAQALILVLLGHRNHKPEVRLGKFLECLLVSLLDPLGEFHLLLDRDELLLADLLQILVQRSALTIGDGLRNL